METETVNAFCRVYLGHGITESDGMRVLISWGEHSISPDMMRAVQINQKTIDIGASFGWHIVGCLENGEIKTNKVYCFPNGVQIKTDT